MRGSAFPAQRPTSSQTKTSSLLTPNASVRGSAAPARELTDGSNITVGVKRFRHAEVLFLPKIYELPDGNIFTVNVVSLQCAGELFLPRVVPADPPQAESASSFSRAAWDATLTPAKYLYANMVFSKWHEHVPEGFLRRSSAQRYRESANLDHKVVFRLFIQTRPLHCDMLVITVPTQG